MVLLITIFNTMWPPMADVKQFSIAARSLSLYSHHHQLPSLLFFYWRFEVTCTFMVYSEGPSLALTLTVKNLNPGLGKTVTSKRRRGPATTTFHEPRQLFEADSAQIHRIMFQTEKERETLHRRFLCSPQRVSFQPLGCRLRSRVQSFGCFSWLTCREYTP